MIETEGKETSGQLTPDQAKNRAVALYRLAFLMTGDRARSVDAVIEAVDSGGNTDSFFSSWLLAWSQRLVIAKVLAGIHDELLESAKRTASLRIGKFPPPASNWRFNPDADSAQIESALLAIDIFPRCALLFTVFEAMPEEDAAILFNVDRDLVRKARIIGLQDLTRNLARMQGWTYTVSRSCLRTKEYQHV